MRPFLLTLFAGLTVAAAPAPKIVDLTGTFTKLFHATEGQPNAVRVARFRAEMANAFPGFYDEKRVGISTADYDALIAGSLERFPAIEAKFTARAAAVAGQLADAQRDFARTFPDSGAMPPTYLIHSLNEMDGGTRDIGGRTVLVFGADVIARVHRPDANERPFFQHELFHVYHEPRFRDCKELWCSLWEEGLATYVAATLNPGAKDDELLLPAADLAAIRAAPTAAACAIRARFTSTDEDDYNLLFTGGKALPGLPARTGYFIGFILAQQLGTGRSVRELANWSVAESRAKVGAALRALAPDCPLPA